MQNNQYFMSHSKLDLHMILRKPWTGSCPVVICLHLLVNYKKFYMNHISFVCVCVCVETLQLFTDMIKDGLKANISVYLYFLNSYLFGHRICGA